MSEDKGQPIRRMDTTVAGFKASAVAAGLKKNGEPDLGLIYSETEAVTAGVFTTNLVKAAPVLVSRRIADQGKARALIVNSGNANACTGEQGLSDARKTTELVAENLGIESGRVLVASTGVIGQRLQMDRIARSLPALVEALSVEGIPQIARAMMTTDSFLKISTADGHAGGESYRIMGIAKGAGMIMPNMATMLCFVLSDVRIGGEELKDALSYAAENTFNRITVDGDTSTNDMVLVMANGCAGNGPMDASDLAGFRSGLEEVMGDLARMIVRDGEGATKLVQVKVRSARNEIEAQKGARTVANSSLVKTAFYGEDPNWGRIMAALGRSGIAMQEDSVDIWIDDVQIVAGGLGKGGEAEKRAAGRMKKKEFVLTVDLHQGDSEGMVFTCDLTHDYVKINADYRT